MKILIIEDDETIRVGLRDLFLSEGWQVLTAMDGEEGLQLAFEEKLEVILLDLMLPKIDGYEICRTLRKERVETPILMLTAKGQVDDVVQGLELGADDYLVKPFSLRELEARVRVLVRRLDQGVSEYRFGDFLLQVRARTLSLSGKEVKLTPKEFDLLLTLLRKPGRALTREQLIGEVWGHGLFVTSRSVDRCVKTLREKLGPTSRNLISVRGIGYRWDEEK